MLYGCEGWLNTSYKELEKLYVSAVNSLLCVRRSTPNDVCLIEAGCLPFKNLVERAQIKFFRQIVAERASLVDAPFMFVLKLAAEWRIPISRKTCELLESNNILGNNLENIKAGTKKKII